MILTMNYDIVKPLLESRNDQMWCFLVPFTDQEFQGRPFLTHYPYNITIFVRIHIQDVN